MTARQQPQNPQPGIAIRGGKQYTSVAFTWRAVPTPDVGYLSGVSCPNPASCIAVGSASNSGFGQADSEAWNGTGMARTGYAEFRRSFQHPVQRVLHGRHPLHGGRHLEGTDRPVRAQPFRHLLRDRLLVHGRRGELRCHRHRLAAQWNGRTWATDRREPGTIETDLSRRPCASTAACLAVGQYIIGNPDSHEEPQLRLDETWNGSSWQIPQSPGYLMQLSSGGTANFNVSWYGSERGALAGGVTAVGIAADAATGGYWIVDATGGVANYHAPWYGSLAGQLSPGAGRDRWTVDRSRWRRC